MLASMAAALVLVLVAAPPLDWLRAQTAAAVATEYGFVPSRLTFQVGVPNRLHLQNRGKELHEFTTPALLQSVEIVNPEAMDMDRREVVLLPRTQKDLYYHLNVFPIVVPPLRERGEDIPLLAWTFTK
jgi:uncharacterized cupredoxin-like copper-binding protein